jgi:hypothetical protein
MHAPFCTVNLMEAKELHKINEKGRKAFDEAALPFRV